MPGGEVRVEGLAGDVFAGARLAAWALMAASVAGVFWRGVTANLAPVVGLASAGFVWPAVSSPEVTLRVESLESRVLRAFGLGVPVGSSRRTSVGDLSSRRPRKAAWRTRLSAVQVAKRTWATNCGLT